MTNRIAFVTYETPFAPCGGVTAVMNYLPEMVESISGCPTTIITPYHFRISKTTSLDHSLTQIAEIEVLYRSEQIKVEILEYVDRIQWVFLKASDKPPKETPFFAGERHPYDVSQDTTRLAPILARDALFFGVAASSALSHLDTDASWTILMQDWEAATTVLISQGLKSASPRTFFLTLHNSYDNGLTGNNLKQFGIDPKTCPGETVLNRALPLVRNPIFTVSGQFALDMTEEVFQSRVLAPHLVEHLKSRLVGINNGAFTKLAIDREVIHQAEGGNFGPLSNWKQERKQAAIAALTAFQPDEERQLWGNSSKFCSQDAAWFIFAGRDDPRQKGFDVACRAVTTFLEKGNRAGFLFFPIPGDEGVAGLRFLRNLASQYPENVLVIPAIFKEGFLAALQGSAYGVMPSFYEPFGMANEFYLNGCVAIGRATGGIIQQIVPLRSIPSFSQPAQRKANTWHAKISPPTGLLYREADRFSSIEADWMAINATDYRIDGSYPDRVEQRERIPLFRAMATALEGCITDAVDLYQSHPQQYYQMLANGIEFIANHFSWEQTARDYYQNLDH
jgi:glycogen synthase